MLNIVEQKLLNNPYKRSTTLSKKDKHKKEGKLRKTSPANVVEVETFINPFVDKTQHLKG